MLSSTVKTIGAILLAVLVMAAVFFGTHLFSQKTADFRGETSKRNLVEANGSYRIAAYDRFYNECASIQGVEDSIANQEAERAAATPSRQAQIDANLTASRNVRASAIRQYNADARKSYTAGQFRSSDLPFQLDPTAKETSCAN